MDSSASTQNRLRLMISSSWGYHKLGHSVNKLGSNVTQVNVAQIAGLNTQPPKWSKISHV